MDRVTMPSKNICAGWICFKKFQITHLIFCIVTYDKYMGKLYRKVIWDKKRIQHQRATVDFFCRQRQGLYYWCLPGASRETKKNKMGFQPAIHIILLLLLLMQQASTIVHSASIYLMCVQLGQIKILHVEYLN